MKYILGSIIICCLFPFVGFGQYYSKGLCEKDGIDSLGRDKWRVGVEALGMFKNNEYFSPTSKGKTLPSMYLRPSVGYQVGDKFLLDVGGDMLWYSGGKNKGSLLPYFRMQYMLGGGWDVVLGSLYGGVNHRLHEGLYRWDRVLEDKQESGLQIRYKNKGLSVDTWVDWEHYIERGEAVPERLQFGLKGEYNLQRGHLGMDVDLALMIYHSGGQIDVSDDPMIVLGNGWFGINTRYEFGRKVVKNVGIGIDWLGYYDRYEDLTRRPYKQGWGGDVYAYVNMFDGLYISMGYWKGKRFYSSKGEELYFGFNPYEIDSRTEKHDLLPIKLHYERQSIKDLYFMVGAEIYKDLSNKQLDYSFYLGMRWRFRHYLSRNEGGRK